MDNRLLQYYERELQHLRETGGEFARAFPKIAGRLGLENYACADPYVERLLEGFSFLAARIQLKIDAEFPRFTNQLLEVLYPQYLAPTPSMVIAQMAPDLQEGNLAAGFTVPRATALTSQLGKGDQTACEFRTAHPVTLWPLQLEEAHYFAFAGEVGGVSFPRLGEIRAGLRLRLRTTAGLSFGEIALDKLPIYLRGSDALPHRLLEQIVSHAVGMVVMPTDRAAAWHKVIDRSNLRPMGFDDDMALLPGVARSFQGHRLLQEYFAFPERFMFVELGGLAPTIQGCAETELDLVILFDQLDMGLEQVLSAENIVLFCTPAINLFPKRADRVHLSSEVTEYHVVPDRTRPLDYEVFQILEVHGFGSGEEARQRFRPLYASHDLSREDEGEAYFSIRRARRMLSDRQRHFGPRSSYIGSETYLSLVDVHEAPFASNLRQLGVDTLCTNRDLVLSMPVGLGKTDFSAESSAPVHSIRCIAGPTEPAPSHTEGETTWRLLNHLALNYLSLIDDANGEGASALRDLLRLHVRPGDTAALRQIDGVRSLSAQGVVRRLPVSGPASFGRGLQLTLTLEEAAFEGASVFLMGAVLEQFFSRYVTMNSFAETVLRTPRRGQVAHWPARGGLCPTL